METPGSVQQQFHTVPIEALKTSPTNPRKSFNEASLQDLAASIREKGILQPLLVRPTSAVEIGDEDTWQDLGLEIVCGERRYRAAKLAAVHILPVRISKLTDQEALELQIIENLQRSDISPLEEAESYQSLLKAANTGKSEADSKETVQSIAQRVGKSKQYVYARLKLLDLGKESRKLLEIGRLSPSHAILLARLDEKHQKAALEAHSLGDEDWSVRNLKDWVDRNVREQERDQKISLALEKAVSAGTPLLKVSSTGYSPKRPKDVLAPEKWEQAGEECVKVQDGLIVEGYEDRGKRVKVCIDANCKHHGPKQSSFGIGRQETAQQKSERGKAIAKERERTKRYLATLKVVVGKVATLTRADLDLVAAQLFKSYVNQDLRKEVTVHFPSLPKAKQSWDPIPPDWIEGLGDREIARLIVFKCLYEDTLGYQSHQEKLKAAAQRYKVSDAEIARELAPVLKPAKVQTSTKLSKPTLKPIPKHKKVPKAKNPAGSRKRR